VSSKVHIFCPNFCLLYDRLVPNQLKDNRSTIACGTGASICFRKRPIVLELREKGTLQRYAGHFSPAKILRSGILRIAAERRQRRATTAQNRQKMEEVIMQRSAMLKYLRDQHQKKTRGYLQHHPKDYYLTITPRPERPRDTQRSHAHAEDCVCRLAETN
jgi:hypothetical protein